MLTIAPHPLISCPRAAGSLRKIQLYGKVVAASRALGSRQIYVPAVNYYSPPLSAVVIVAGIAVFVACKHVLSHLYVQACPHLLLSVDVRRPSVYMAQQGDGTQSAHCHPNWLALPWDSPIFTVCIHPSPFADAYAHENRPSWLRVFATKVNLIGMVTGVSHEKLQVYHRWSAWFMCTCSLVDMLGSLS